MKNEDSCKKEDIYKELKGDFDRLQDSFIQN